MEIEFKNTGFMFEPGVDAFTATDYTAATLTAEKGVTAMPIEDAAHRLLSLFLNKHQSDESISHAFIGHINEMSFNKQKFFPGILECAVHQEQQDHLTQRNKGQRVYD